MLLNILQCTRRRPTENDPAQMSILPKVEKLGTQMQMGEGNTGLGACFKHPVSSPAPPHRSTLLIASEYAA